MIIKKKKKWWWKTNKKMKNKLKFGLRATWLEVLRLNWGCN